MIGDYMNNMSGNADAEGAVEEMRPTGQSGSGVSVDVVTPMEELHGFFPTASCVRRPTARRSAGGATRRTARCTGVVMPRPTARSGARLAGGPLCVRNTDWFPRQTGLVGIVQSVLSGDAPS
jgi:hypothetical protein